MKKTGIVRHQLYLEHKTEILHLENPYRLQSIYTMLDTKDFGSGLMQLVFGAPNDEMVAATQFLVQGSLQQWLGDLIEVEAVELQGQEGHLYITVRYTVRPSQEQQVARFER